MIYYLVSLVSLEVIKGFGRNVEVVILLIRDDYLFIDKDVHLYHFNIVIKRIRWKKVLRCMRIF